MRNLLTTTTLALSCVGLAYAALEFTESPADHNHNPGKYQSQSSTLNSSDPSPAPFSKYYVHLIPHTHDDVGWLKTVDEYFSGSKYHIQPAGVELILDTVINELLEDPAKRFSYVEMKFFSMWWKTQTEQRKQDVRMLVKEGRLEFLNAGWSMHDEACTHYEDMINNMMHGHKFLMDEFGVRPRIGWHIDPFGHSATNARLFADMGFDAWFFSRLDYQDRDRRLEQKEMEFLWRPSFNHFGLDKQIFTHTLFYGYSAPRDFDFDTTSKDEPVVDNPNLSTYNMEQRASEFMTWIVNMTQHYATNHIFVTMGEDFQYSNAKMNFKSIDRLMNYFNNRYSNVTLMYSTPSNYIDSLAAMDKSWPVKYDDMFPYADNNVSYWTGYFTSRANAKLYFRRGSQNHHASSKLYSLEAIDQSSSLSRLNDVLKAKDTMMDVMGVLQHHDAAPGTAKQAVAENYNSKLFKAMQANNQLFSQIIGEAAESLAGIVGNSINGEWQWCLKENTTYLDCPIGNTKPDFNQDFIVGAYNPSAIPRNYISVAVPHGLWDVMTFDQVHKVFVKADAVVICDKENYPPKYYQLNNCFLYVFYPLDAHQVGLIAVNYNVANDLQLKNNSTAPPTISTMFEDIIFLKEDPTIGLIFNISKQTYKEIYQVAFDLRYYPAYQGGNKTKSGAYMFTPDSFITDSLRYGMFQVSQIAVYTSLVVSQMTLVFNDVISGQSATVKLKAYYKDPIIEWQVKLDGIPLSEQGQEVTVNFQSLDIDNNDTFYTDSNGMEMQERKLNYRQSWQFQETDNITSNYYPINSAIAIRGEGHQMTVMTPRPQGGSVLRKGRIELMHNRRLYFDDHRGVNEALNETDEFGNGITVTSSYYMHLFDSQNEKSLQRQFQLAQDQPFQYFYNFNYTNDFTKITKSLKRLPTQAELEALGFSDSMKFEVFPINKNSLILRVENLNDIFDNYAKLTTNNDINATPPFVQIDQLANLLYQLANNGDKPQYVSISETTLTGNQLQTAMEAEKVQWTGVDDDFIDPRVYPADKSLLNVAVDKQAIRTFALQFIPQRKIKVGEQAQ